MSAALHKQGICHVKHGEVQYLRVDFVSHLVASVLPGSDEEREAFEKANHLNKLLHQQQNQGLHIAIKVGTDVRKGCNFDVFAVVTNNTQSVKKCRLLFGSCAVSYNGFLGGNCGFKDLLNVELSPGASELSCHHMLIYESLKHIYSEY